MDSYIHIFANSHKDAAISLFLLLVARLLLIPTGVHGTVRSAAGLPLRAVRVEVDGEQRAVTDSMGHYAVSPLAVGSHELRFMVYGFATRRISALLAEGGDMALDVELSPSVVVLPTISVTAVVPTATAINAPTDPDGSHELGRYRIGHGWQGDMLSEGIDIQKALASVPGVAGRGEDATSISIRGGAASDNLLLLDGIPIYGGSHFGNASSAILPDAIAFMDVHTGISSARYGGRLSGVVELETADSGVNGYGIGGAVNATDVRALVRGPIGGSRGAYMLGARTSFRSAWQSSDGFTQEASYHDFIGVGRLNVAGGSLRLVSFLSGNHLGLEPSTSASTPGYDDASPVDPALASAGTRLGWRSSSVGATWTQLDANGGEVRLRAWYAGAAADITWLPVWGSAQLHSDVSEVGLSAEAGRESARGSRLFGASVVRPATAYSVEKLSSSDMVASGNSIRSASPSIASLFTEWSWRPGSRFVARGGLRGNASTDNEVNLEPRVDLTLHTSSNTHFDIGAGRTHQTLQSMFNEENLLGTLIGLELPAAAGASLPTAVADQLGLGVEHRVNDRVTFTLDGYLRRWSGVPLPAGTTGGLFVTDSLVIGTGHSSGVVLGASYRGQRLTARGSFSVAQSVRQFGGESYHAGVERPWTFAGTVGYRLGRRTAAQLTFSTGAGEPSSITGGGVDWRPDHLPTQSGDLEGTPVNLPGPVNIERLPGYTRIDLGVRRNWPLALAGHQGALTTSVRAVNLLNTTNGIGVVAQAGSSLQVVRGSPRGLTFELGWIF